LSRLPVSPQARSVWARTALHVWPEPYLLVSLPPVALADAAALMAKATGFASLVVERDEVSLTLAKSLWEASPLRVQASGVAGPYRAVTLDVDIDLGVVGYLAPAAARLAGGGISIVPQCGFRKDHLLVREKDLERACRLIEELIEECAADGNTREGK
jgi:hypothetical protein